MKVKNKLRVVTYTKNEQHLVYFGYINGVIRWVGCGKPERLGKAISGDHTAQERYGAPHFDEVVVAEGPMSKALGIVREAELVEVLGRQVLNVQNNPYGGISAREQMGLPISDRDRSIAGLKVGKN